MEDIIEALKWRYAVKRFNPEKKLKDDQIDRLLEGLALTATSMGLQLMEFLVISNPDLKEQLKPLAFNQPQIDESSHLIVMCRKTSVSVADIDSLIQLSVDKRNLDPNAENVKGYEKMLKSTLQMPANQQQVWMDNQVYIAMGNLMTICAVEKVDACPMEGFDRNKVDQLLGLPQKGLQSVLICALGYRSDEDKYQHLAKIRRPKKSLVTYIK